MIDPAAACARGRARASWPRTQAEADAGGIGEDEDKGPAKLWRVIRACGVVGSIISMIRAQSPSSRTPCSFQPRWCASSWRSVRSI